MLLPGVPAAHRLIRLMLLPSRPDMVHGRKLHGTRPSTHPLLPCGKTSNGMRLFNYTTFPLALQGENERFFHFSNYTKKQLQTVRKNDMILICALFFCEQMYCEYRMRTVFSVQRKADSALSSSRICEKTEFNSFSAKNDSFSAFSGLFIKQFVNRCFYAARRNRCILLRTAALSRGFPGMNFS